MIAENGSRGARERASWRMDRVICSRRARGFPAERISRAPILNDDVHCDYATRLQSYRIDSIIRKIPSDALRLK